MHVPIEITRADTFGLLVHSPNGDPMARGGLGLSTAQPPALARISHPAGHSKEADACRKPT